MSWSLFFVTGSGVGKKLTIAALRPPDAYALAPDTRTQNHRPTTTHTSATRVGVTVWSQFVNVEK